MKVKPRVLILVGYFDWFSGYQETVLAAAFAQLADTEVVASDRVSQAFSDSHLTRLGATRRYQAGSAVEHNVKVTRFAVRELRSMVWSGAAREYIDSREYDLIVQVMPGQAFPVAASLSKNAARKVVLYGDNRAMWAHLGPLQRLVKGCAFTVSKGLVYAFVNSRADALYGYTQNTIERLRPFCAGKPMEIMPLAYSSERFFFDDGLRTATRERLGFADRDIVLLSAGKYSAQKRLDWVVRATAAIRPRNPRLRTVFVGVGNSGSSRIFRDQVARSSAADRISVVDFMSADQLNAVFNAADLGIWPRYPAITIQQAMGTGLPVVLPNNDLVGHLIRPGDGTGSYFELVPGEEEEHVQEALSAALSQLEGELPSRQRRVQLNSWLSADRIADDLLAAHTGTHPGVDQLFPRKGAVDQ